MHSSIKFTERNKNAPQLGSVLIHLMSWSWYNPSSEEAQEAYAYYKSKYTKAANKKYATEKKLQTYRAQRSSLLKQTGTLMTAKLNLEKRLNGIENIIRMLEGSGGWLSTSVPEAISKAQRTLSKANQSLGSCIRLIGGSAAANLETALEIKTVEGDIHSSTALKIYKNERERLETKIAEYKSKLANLTDQASSLTKKINSCTAEISSLKTSMYSYAYDMNHYYRKLN